MATSLGVCKENSFAFEPAVWVNLSLEEEVMCDSFNCQQDKLQQVIAPTLTLQM